MMRIFAMVTVMLLLVNCSVKQHKKVALVAGGGVFVSTVDSSLIKDISTVHLNNGSSVVIFPVAFAKKGFGNASWLDSSLFFKPDTSTVITACRKIREQYCSAIENYYNNKNLSELGKVFCRQFKERSALHNVQVLGYTSHNGEKMLLANFIDFTEDPHKLKTYFTSSWISGWHGWFYSNVLSVDYNLNKQQVIIER